MDYVGINLHKKESQICLLTETREVMGVAPLLAVIRTVNQRLGSNEFASAVAFVTDDAGTPFAVAVIPVDDRLAVKAQQE